MRKRSRLTSSFAEEMHEGTHGDYWWVQSSVLTLSYLVSTHYHIFESSHVAITAFDSSTLKLTPEEIDAGWTDLAGIALSPKIESRIDLPIGEYDEWYLFGSRPKPFEPTDTHVNCALELRDPEWKKRTADPSWDRVAIRAQIETIRQRQEKFWSDIDRIRPNTMIMDGSIFALVTRDSHVAKAIVDIA